MAQQKMVVEHGPCCCKTEFPTERLYPSFISPMQSVVYSLGIEADMKRRTLLDQYSAGREASTLHRHESPAP